MGHFWKGRCFQDKCIEMYSTFEIQVGFSIRYIVFCRPLSANEGSNGMICRQNIGYCTVRTPLLLVGTYSRTVRRTLPST